MQADTGEHSDREEQGNAQSGEVGEEDATLDRQDRTAKHHRGRNEREVAVTGQLAGEEEGAEHREDTPDCKCANRGSEREVTSEEEQRPSEGILREELAVARGREERLEEVGEAEIDAGEVAIA